MYQLNGEDHVLAWLRGEPSSELREALLGWLPKLAEDPAGVAFATGRRPGVPAYVAVVPATQIFVDYTVIDQYRTVLILNVVTLRFNETGEEVEQDPEQDPAAEQLRPGPSAGDDPTS